MECGRPALSTVTRARKQSPSQMQEFESLLLEDEICSKVGAPHGRGRFGRDFHGQLAVHWAIPPVLHVWVSQGGPTQTFQDLAVLVLLGAAGFSLAKLLFKLAIVIWALAAAGIRYIILGIILLLVVAML